MLQKTAEVFEKLIGYKYIFHLEDGRSIKFVLESKHFYHLIGLHKLTDIYQLDGKVYHYDSIFKKILKGEITLELLKKSQHFHLHQDRIMNFEQLAELLDFETFESILVDFDGTKLPHSMKTKMEAEVCLYKNNNNLYKHLFIAKDKAKDEYYAETFFVRNDDYYIAKQIELKIVRLEKIALRKSKGQDFSKNLV